MHGRAVSEICGKQPVQYLQAAVPAEKTGRSRGRLPESFAFPAGKRRHACQRGSGSDVRRLLYFFFNDTATTEIYTLSLHDALPISFGARLAGQQARHAIAQRAQI